MITPPQECRETNVYFVRFGVFTAVTMKNSVFWDVLIRTTRRNIPEDAILLLLCSDSLFYEKLCSFQCITCLLFIMSLFGCICYLYCINAATGWTTHLQFSDNNNNNNIF
jgi:hypothetical protein